MNLGTSLHTLLFGRKMGKDMFGNVYYSARRADAAGKVRRWVMYNGLAEPSKVPPMWHAWLHYMTDMTPDEHPIQPYDWQKDHLPNLTGTVNAYKPRGDLSSGMTRDKSIADYQAWNPDNAQR